jgi:hypothetical protein
VRAWWAVTRAWRWRSPAGTARLLARFSRTERSSFHDLMAAANTSPAPERRAAYLRHALDERAHADAFAKRAVALDPALADDPDLWRADFEHLYDTLGEPAFVAFVHRGEARGRAQMEVYARELRALEGGPRADPETAAMFERIGADEARHEAYTAGLVHALGGSPWRAAAWEAWRGWRRAGAALSGVVFSGLVTAGAVLLGPVAWLERRRT